MHAKIKPLALILGSTFLVVGCGGGGGSSGSTDTNTTPSTPTTSTNVTITPSLGRFATGCPVELRSSDGTLLGTTTITSQGTASVTIQNYTGPVIAQVKGAANCTYFDEATGTDKPFGAGQTMTAVLDSVRSEFSINALTNLAAARVLDGTKLASGKTADSVKEENATVQRMFGVSDMFIAPTLIASTTDKLDNSDASKLAAKLAALSELAKSQSTDLVTLANNLANDIKDGTFDSLSSSALQSALTTTAGKYANAAAKAELEDLAQNTTLVLKVADVKADVDKVLKAGTALTQAKAIFSDLRTSILSLSNDAGTGSLDAESALLDADFQNGVATQGTTETIQMMIESANAIFLHGETSVGTQGSGRYCALSAANQITCQFGIYNGQRLFRVVMTPTQTGVSWNIPWVKNTQTGAISNPSGLTGTMTAASDGSSASFSGKYFPMVKGADYTDTNLNYTASGSAAAGTQLWTANGTLTTKSGSSTVLDVNLNSLNINEAAKTASMTLTLTSPHHQFVGTLSVSGILGSGENQAPQSARFVGSFTNVASNYKIFEGTLTAGQDWTNYDPTLVTSSSNYAKASLGFNGTLYKSAGVTGVALSLSANNFAGVNSTTINLGFKGNSGLQTTGSVTLTDGAGVWSLSNENGVKANYSTTDRSGKVLASDNTELGTISSKRITFIDGTFESLI
ncbi:MAG: hypothetical protein LWW92_06525 [Rhodocyclales bacterium]|nr:hypothetical protein [Rhodocyclales bacterium]